MTSEDARAAGDAPGGPAREGRLGTQVADPSGPTPGVEPHADPLKESAPRRTLLAAERTYLAWLRTGLGAIGVALAVGRLIPVLLGGSNLAYAWLGAGYGMLGIFLIGYALLRARRVSAALHADADINLDWWALAITTAGGLALAVATIVMVIAEV